jgi:hypothetical protein
MPRLAGLLLVLAALRPLAAEAAQDPAVDRVLGTGVYQTELPGQSPEVANAGAAGSARRGARGRPADRAAAPPVSTPAAALARMLLLFFLGAGLLVLLIRLGLRFREKARHALSAAAAGAPDSVPAPGDSDPGGTTRDPRVLLGRILALLVARDLLELGPATTGREALRRARLDGAAAAALERLVGAVEASAFGGHPLDVAAQDDCGASYRTLAAQLGAPEAAG